MPSGNPTIADFQAVAQLAIRQTGIIKSWETELYVKALAETLQMAVLGCQRALPSRDSVMYLHQ